MDKAAADARIFLQRAVRWHVPFLLLLAVLALHSLSTRCNYTHEQLAKRLGKSRTAITESLSLAKMPDEVKNLCRLADISSKSLLLEIVRQPDAAKMIALIERITSRGHATRDQVRQEVAKRKPGRPKAFTFQYRPPTKAFALRLTFRKGHADPAEVIETLESILRELRTGKSAAV